MLVITHPFFDMAGRIFSTKKKDVLGGRSNLFRLSVS